MSLSVLELSRAFLFFIAFTFGAYGVVGLIDPVDGAANLGISTTTNDGRTELRSTYGGLLIGIGAFLAYSAYQRSAIPSGLMFVACFGVGIGIVRAYGIIADGTRAPIHWQFLAMELGSAAIAVALMAFGREATRG